MKLWYNHIRFSPLYKIGVSNMATTTFDKNIEIDQPAAEHLVSILTRPAPPRPKLDDRFWEENERKVREWLSHSEKQ